MGNKSGRLEISFEYIKNLKQAKTDIISTMTGVSEEIAEKLSEALDALGKGGRLQRVNFQQYSSDLLTSILDPNRTAESINNAIGKFLKKYDAVSEITKKGNITSLDSFTPVQLDRILSKYDEVVEKRKEAEAVAGSVNYNDLAAEAEIRSLGELQMAYAKSNKEIKTYRETLSEYLKSKSKTENFDVSKYDALINRYSTILTIFDKMWNNAPKKNNNESDFDYSDRLITNNEEIKSVYAEMKKMEEKNPVLLAYRKSIKTEIESMGINDSNMERLTRSVLSTYVSALEKSLNAEANKILSGIIDKIVATSERNVDRLTEATEKSNETLIKHQDKINNGSKRQGTFANGNGVSVDSPQSDRNPAVAVTQEDIALLAKYNVSLKECESNLNRISAAYNNTGTLSKISSKDFVGYYERYLELAKQEGIEVPERFKLVYDELYNNGTIQSIVETFNKIKSLKRESEDNPVTGSAETLSEKHNKSENVTDSGENEEKLDSLRTRIDGLKDSVSPLFDMSKPNIFDGMANSIDKVDEKLDDVIDKVDRKLKPLNTDDKTKKEPGDVIDNVDERIDTIIDSTDEETGIADVNAIAKYLKDKANPDEALSFMKEGNYTSNITDYYEQLVKAGVLYQKEGELIAERAKFLDKNNYFIGEEVIGKDGAGSVSINPPKNARGIVHTHIDTGDGVNKLRFSDSDLDALVTGQNRRAAIFYQNKLLDMNFDNVADSQIDGLREDLKTIYRSVFAYFGASIKEEANKIVLDVKNMPVDAQNKASDTINALSREIVEKYGGTFSIAKYDKELEQMWFDEKYIPTSSLTDKDLFQIDKIGELIYKKNFSEISKYIKQIENDAEQFQGNANIPKTKNANSKNESQAEKSIMFHWGKMNGKPTHPLLSEIKEAGKALADGYKAYADGTGLYTTSDINEVRKMISGKDISDEDALRRFYALDVSDLNLFNANTEAEAEAFFNFQHKLERYCITLGSMFRGFESIEGELSINDLDEEKLFNEAKSIFKNYSNIFDSVYKDIDSFTDFINEMIDLVGSTGLDDKGNVPANKQKNLIGADDIKTRFMKSLGFDGFNLSGTSYDSTNTGNVIYDPSKIDKSKRKSFNTIEELEEYAASISSNVTPIAIAQEEAKEAVTETNAELKEQDKIVTTSPSESPVAMAQNEATAAIKEVNAELDEQKKKIEPVSTNVPNTEEKRDRFEENEISTESGLYDNLAKSVRDAAIAKRDFASANAGVSLTAEQSASNLKQEAISVEDVSEKMRSAVNIARDFASANAGISLATEDSTSKLKEQSSSIEKFADNIKTTEGVKDALGRTYSDITDAANHAKEAMREFYGDKAFVPKVSDADKTNMDSIAASIKEVSDNAEIAATNISSFNSENSQITNNTDAINNALQEEARIIENIALNMKAAADAKNTFANANKQVGESINHSQLKSESTVNIIENESNVEKSTVIPELAYEFNDAASKIDSASNALARFKDENQQAISSVQESVCHLRNEASAANDIESNMSRATVTKNEFSQANERVASNAKESALALEDEASAALDIYTNMGNAVINVKEFLDINSNVSSSAQNSTANLSNEAIAVEKIATNMSSAVAAVKNFSKVNTTIADNANKTADALERESKAIVDDDKNSKNQNIGSEKIANQTFEALSQDYDGLKNSINGAIDATNNFIVANNNVATSTEDSIARLKQEAELAEIIGKNMATAATAKDKFAKANADVLESAKKSAKELKNESKSAENVESTLVQGTDVYEDAINKISAKNKDFKAEEVAKITRSSRYSEKDKKYLNSYNVSYEDGSKDTFGENGDLLIRNNQIIKLSDSYKQLNKNVEQYYNVRKKMEKASDATEKQALREEAARLLREQSNIRKDIRNQKEILGLKRTDTTSYDASIKETEKKGKDNLQRTKFQEQLKQARELYEQQRKLRRELKVLDKEKDAPLYNAKLEEFSNVGNQYRNISKQIRDQFIGRLEGIDVQAELRKMRTEIDAEYKKMSDADFNNKFKKLFKGLSVFETKHRDKFYFSSLADDIDKLKESLNNIVDSRNISKLNSLIEEFENIEKQVANFNKTANVDSLVKNYESDTKKYLHSDRDTAFSVENERNKSHMELYRFLYDDMDSDMRLDDSHINKILEIENSRILAFKKEMDKLNSLRAKNSINDEYSAYVKDQTYVVEKLLAEAKKAAGNIEKLFTNAYIREDQYRDSAYILEYNEERFNDAFSYQNESEYKFLSRRKEKSNAEKQDAKHKRDNRKREKKNDKEYKDDREKTEKLYEKKFAVSRSLRNLNPQMDQRKYAKRQFDLVFANAEIDDWIKELRQKYSEDVVKNLIETIKGKVEEKYVALMSEDNAKKQDDAFKKKMAQVTKKANSFIKNEKLSDSSQIVKDIQNMIENARNDDDIEQIYKTIDDFNVNAQKEKLNAQENNKLKKEIANFQKKYGTKHGDTDTDSLIDQLNNMLASAKNEEDRDLIRKTMSDFENKQNLIRQRDEAFAQNQKNAYAELNSEVEKFIELTKIITKTKGSDANIKDLEERERLLERINALSESIFKNGFYESEMDNKVVQSVLKSEEDFAKYRYASIDEKISNFTKKVDDTNDKRIRNATSNVSYDERIAKNVKELKSLEEAARSAKNELKEMYRNGDISLEQYMSLALKLRKSIHENNPEFYRTTEEYKDKVYGRKGKDSDSTKIEYNDYLSDIKRFETAVDNINKLRIKDDVEEKSFAGRIEQDVKSLERLRTTAENAREEIKKLFDEGKISERQYVNASQILEEAISKSDPEYYKTSGDYIDALSNSKDMAEKMNAIIKNMKVPDIVLNRFNALRVEAEEIAEKLANNKDDNKEEYIKTLNRIYSDIRKLSKVGAGDAVGIGYADESKAIEAMQQYASSHGKITKDIRKTGTNGETSTYSMEILSSSGMLEELKFKYSDFAKSVTVNTRQIRKELTGLPGFFNTLGNKFKQMAVYWTATFFDPYDFIQYGRQVLDMIVQLDDALIDLQKTSTMSTSELNQFYKDANANAKELGISTQEFIQQAADMSRSGFSSKTEATNMARYSAQFSAISPDIDTSEATTGLVSIMKAFDIESEDVLDGIISKVNVLGNSFSETNGDILEGLERSSASMAAANNSLDETMALFTAG